ncbi:hypothetical protein QVD17_19581 [Tagetes erecta]|uniref:Uncharacterized protein n=1 Tax=Tagetes erecta TaxID=13708 RepID=A0AAD8KQ01_TARER|nr:hypothetical protein QVD17_19581 [Tagetes erecta]
MLSQWWVFASFERTTNLKSNGFCDVDRSGRTTIGSTRRRTPISFSCGDIVSDFISVSGYKNGVVCASQNHQFEKNWEQVSCIVIRSGGAKRTVGKADQLVMNVVVGNSLHHNFFSIAVVLYMQPVHIMLLLTNAGNRCCCQNSRHNNKIGLQFSSLSIERYGTNAWFTSLPLDLAQLIDLSHTSP